MTKGLTKYEYMELRSITTDLSNKAEHSIQRNNLAEFLTIIAPELCELLIPYNYEANEIIVENGEIVSSAKILSDNLDYANVPLGIITSGSITVSKNGRGVKKLAPGDFIGLFETSDYILHSKKRTIGEWTLVSNEDTEIIYFSDSVFLLGDEIMISFKKYLTELSRKDPVPKPLTDLPLLDWVASHTTKSRQKDCAIIIHTHLLPNNVPLFRHLYSLIDTHHIYVLDKPYSTVPSTYDNLVRSGFDVVPVHIDQNLPYEFSAHKSLDILWDRVKTDYRKNGFKKLLIVDDGGEVWRSIPKNELSDVLIAVVEQTQRGITYIGENSKHPPIVSVATCGIKKMLEPEFIAKSVYNELFKHVEINKDTVIGIIGSGAIGLSLYKNIKKNGLCVYTYDNDASMQTPDSLNSLDDIINKSDVIIGTTGLDSLRGLPFDRVLGSKKILVSASSADIEYASLLKIAKKSDSLFDTKFVEMREGLHFELINGGYPINFNRVYDSTPDEDIVLTRCLMYIAAMQALELVNNGRTDSVIIQLDKKSQSKLLEKWFADRIDLVRPSDEEFNKIINYSYSSNHEIMPSVWID